jgi:hypothetical protein
LGASCLLARNLLERDAARRLALAEEGRAALDAMIRR